MTQATQTLPRKPQPKKETRLLMHKFSDDEKTEMTENLTSQMMKIESLQEKKKAKAAKYKRRIDTLAGHNSKLAKWIHEGEHEQNTAVEVLYNWPKDGICTITRTDTYEQWEAPMDENTLDKLPDFNTGSDDEE